MKTRTTSIRVDRPIGGRLLLQEGAPVDFDKLQPGQSMDFINDHDPKPPHYQFQAERAGTFGWTYLEQGPQTWRGEISKQG